MTERQQSAFNRIDPAYGPARSDFFRYHLMSTRGGVWLDMKSGVLEPLDKTFDKYSPLPPLVLGNWSWPNQAEFIPADRHKRGEIQNWHLISAPGHVIWEVVMNHVVENIERYDAKRDGVGKMAVLKLTGPITMSRTDVPHAANVPAPFGQR